ncbi:TolB-like translocation protein [Klebsiella quasipneumoniae]|uniref:hypothetical protein n=1 Tax=Klebsiella quasipneumoniae TaxID=1463165 RepID=UPI001D125522|nr:hypothetical protein [Klebsiella quasipneumoniae]
MAVTDTQQAAQFSADAAVSAAEAKQYLIEVQQGYQDISATAQEAIDAATAAEAAKISAETAEQNSSVSAVASSESATAAAGSAAQAEEYANNASDYARNKFTFYKTASDPDGTIAGLAATTDGQSFWVAQGPDALSAAWQYQNKAGVAVLQAKQPGTAAITSTIRLYENLAAAQADVAAGNILANARCYVREVGETISSAEYQNISGVLQETGVVIPVGESLVNLSGLNKYTRFIFPEDGEYDFGIPFDVLLEDAEHNIIYTLNGNKFKFYGDVEFDSVETGVITVNGVPVDLSGILSPDEKENLVAFSDMTKFSSADDTGEFDFGFGFDVILEDMNGDLIYGIKGTEIRWFTSARFPAVKCDSLMAAGVNVDPNGIPTASERDALNAYSTSTVIRDPAEFAFNPKVALMDSQNNTLIDYEEYNEKKKNWDEAWEITQQIKPQETNPLCPWSELDSNGKYQVSVMDISTNQQIQVTSGTSNETSPRPDVLDRIVWQSDRADPPPGGLFYAQLPDFTPHAYIARKKIVGWGHSFINNGAFLRRIYQLTGLPTYNFGLAGQTSDAIAARQGGAPAYYAPVGGSIPASGAVTLTPAVPGPCRSLASPVALKCSLAGVDGTFTWDGTSAVFTRETAGDAVPVSVQVPLFVYPITTVNVTGSISKDTQFDLHDECINIFWIGRNNLSETDLIMQNMVSMVEYVKNIGQKIVILAEFNSSGEPTGSAGFNQMTELNRRYKEKYPDFYCEIDGVDVLQNFINNANPNSPDDMSDVEAGLTPRSLRYDNLHPSQQITGNGGSLTPEFALDYGANVNANFVKQFLINKGWL